MRSVTLGVILLATTLPSAFAQQPDIITPGMGVRFREPGWFSGWTVGRIAGLRDDSLLIQRDADTLAVALGSVRQLEVNFRGGFRHRAALVGALKGLGSGTLSAVLTSMQEDREATSGDMAALIVVPVSVGYLMGGGGTNARTGAAIGMLVGAPIGIVVMLAEYEPCTPGSFLCFDEGSYVLLGALAGAGLGGLAGTIVGAFIPGDHWERVRADRIRLSLAPRPEGGASFGATLRF